MRRLVLPVIVACGLVLIGSSSAFAEDPAPTVSVPAAAGKRVCKIADKRLPELSGIVATKTGYIVVNDSTEVDDQRQVFFLDAQCKVTKAVPFSGRPRDPEDLVLSADGKTLWIADIGDNSFDDPQKRRANISFWTMPADGSAEPVIHRVSYPEGDHHDAEAMLLNGDGTPLVITKEIGKPAYVYQPTAPLQKNNKTGVPLERVAELTLSATQTPGNPYARIGNKTIDGGAVSPAGNKVVLRTYTDALEWDVANGDVLGALKQKPRTTGLPNEPLGEAIGYSADGKTFLTVSDMSGETTTANYILRYTPATTVAAAAKNGGGADDGKKWYADLELSDITYAVGGVGVLGLLLVGIGVFGIARHRKRVAAEPALDTADDDALDDGPEKDLIGVGGGSRAAVYGGGSGAVAAGGSGVYGGAGGQRSGAIPGAGGQRSGAIPGAAGAGVDGQRGSGVYGGGRGPQYGGAGDARQPGRGGPPPARGGSPARGGEAPPVRGPQAQPGGGGGVYGGQPGRDSQGQPPRGPQGQPPRGPQGQPGRAPQGQPPRGSQGQPGRAPQGQPARGPQGQPGRAPQGQPARGPQGQPPRGPQGQPGRAPQSQQPPRGPQGQPPRGPQPQPPRGPQGQPPHGGQGGQGRQPGVYGPPPAGGGRPDAGRQRDDYADYRRGSGSRFEGFDYR